MIQRGSNDSKRPRTIKFRFDQTPKVLKVLKVDWRAYFRRFCEEHGEPVEHGGKLLFSDGWTYSSTDHAGPEWPPPLDPQALRSLQLSYWVERFRLVTNELRQLKQALFNVKQLIASRSVPLMRTANLGKDSEGRWMGTSREEISTEALEMRIEWLEAEVSAANQRVGELEHETVESQSV